MRGPGYEPRWDPVLSATEMLTRAKLVRVPLHWHIPRGFRDAVRTVDRAQRSKPCHSWILLAPLPPELSSSVPPVRTLVDRRLAASFRDTGDSLLESTLNFISRVITIYTTVWYVCQRLFCTRLRPAFSPTVMSFIQRFETVVNDKKTKADPNLVSAFSKYS